MKNLLQESRRNALFNDSFSFYNASYFMGQSFLSSGFISLIGTSLFDFSIPLDLLLMAFTRPISSQTSLIILKRIYDHYGIDHLYSLMGSILQTGSDTTLYVVSLYYGSIHLKKYSYTLWLGFFLDFLSFVFMLCFYYLGMIS